MEEIKWNFHALPPVYSHYTREEANAELIHATKAYSTCKSVAKVFAECRRKPSGKIVHPESCQTHAESLQSCYNAIKIIPASCQSDYSQVYKCLNENKSCEVQMNAYIRCEHPAFKAFSDYH